MLQLYNFYKILFTSKIKIRKTSANNHAETPENFPPIITLKTASSFSKGEFDQKIYLFSVSGNLSKKAVWVTKSCKCQLL